MKPKPIHLKIKNYYEKQLNVYGNNFRGMNWSSKKSQYLRFNQITKYVDFKNKSIFDFGCGNGEFLLYLKKNKILFKSYIGADISEQMINLCHKRFKKNKKFSFYTFKKNKKVFKKKYDIVISSGVFNVKNNISNKKWLNYIFFNLKYLFKITKKTLIINFLTFNVDFKNKNLFYMSLDILLKFLKKNLSKKILINHNYNLWEFTINIYK